MRVEVPTAGGDREVLEHRGLTSGNVLLENWTGAGQTSGGKKSRQQYNESSASKLIAGGMK